MIADLPTSAAAFSPSPMVVEPTGRRGSGRTDDILTQPIRLLVKKGTLVETTGDVRDVLDPIETYRAELIEHYKLEMHVRIALRNRLQQIKEDAATEHEPVSDSSLNDFATFISLTLPTRRPSLFLLEKGNIRALWLNDKKEQVGLQFMGDGEVQFVMFVQRRRLVARDHGSEALDSMLGKIRSNRSEHLLYA